MQTIENRARIDVRKALIGGFLAWAIQALVIVLWRFP